MQTPVVPSLGACEIGCGSTWALQREAPRHLSEVFEMSSAGKRSNLRPHRGSSGQAAEQLRADMPAAATVWRCSNPQQQLPTASAEPSTPSRTRRPPQDTPRDPATSASQPATSGSVSDSYLLLVTPLRFYR